MSMTATILAPTMTTDELLALPENGMDRWLVRGQLREKPMTVRNRFHSKIMAALCGHLFLWLKKQPLPRGDVLCGEAGVRLSGDPDSTFGIDVVYISADMAQRQTDSTTLLDGVPILAVEILSPSDTTEEVDEKIDCYQEAGVPLVWVVDPHDRTILVYRPGAEPQLVTSGQEIADEPHLPGFRLKVAEIFD
jgi:Uma2 family endonuclease